MKWYVFDKYDCFGSADTASEAAVLAEFLVKSEMTGIEIKYMSDTEFQVFCKGH